jgi:hypothetical protein
MLLPLCIVLHNCVLQVAAAAYVDRVNRKQSVLVLRCTWLLWRLAVGGEKVSCA